MIITNVVVENFRCYYGRSSIEFNREGKITLIWGDSGYGKSSFIQFFRWMFYGEHDFGENNDKPIFNIAAFKEKKMGESLRVYGQIDFEHLGVKYSLRKELIFPVTINFTFAKYTNSDCSLLTLNNDTWIPYAGDISNKINSIFPRELSKYFLLYGEKARSIVLDSIELRKAIHSLFGLNVYEQAIKHIGTQSNPRTVLGVYKKQMTSKISIKHGTSPSSYQDAIEDQFYVIETCKKKLSELEEKISKAEKRKEELIQFLGRASNKGDLQQIIKSNETAIKQYEQVIVETKKRIGNLFYKNYPYLMLAKLASKSSAILREKNKELSTSYRNVFENLNKDLLREILHKNKCVCGRTLDDSVIKHIDGTIATMPPDSYVYQFGQFISKAKNNIQASRIEKLAYNDLILRIAELEKNIAQLNEINKQKLEELRKFDSSQKQVEELELLGKELEKARREQVDETKKLGSAEHLHNKLQVKLDEVINASKVSAEFRRKLDFFESLKERLINEKVSKETEIKEILNTCVRDIFKKLTTQTEINADEIQFINDDFSLRTTYLTGGQLAVDVYSYVIGIIKALQECKLDNNENPIIVDAPFAFTGNSQSEHIFKTLPTVSKQTILLTLDLNKINDLLDEKDLYDFYVIDNETQEKAIIKRGNPDDFKY